MRIEQKTKLFCIDTESGGLDCGIESDFIKGQSILSFGGVVWNRETGAIEDEIELFIKEDPVVAVAGALKANQIDLDWLNANGLPPKEAMGQLKTFLTKNFGNVHRDNLIPLTAYNLKFDLGFFRRLCHKAGLHEEAFDQRFSYPKACSYEFMRFCQMVLGFSLDKCKLENVLEYLQIEPVGVAHSALDDARNVVQVMNKLRQSFRLEL